MWIVPKQLISASALDTEALISDSSEFSQVAEQSLMWRSKPSPSRTWSRRWKRESWLRLLSGRILKPSTGASFVERWTSSLEASLVSRSLRREVEEQTMTLGTCGHTSPRESELSTLPLFSWKMSTASSPQDLKGTDGATERGHRWRSMSSENWREWVIEQRRAHLARSKSEHLTREREYSFSQRGETSSLPLLSGENLFSGGQLGEAKNNLLGRRRGLSPEVWPTPSASEDKYRLTGESQQSRCLNALQGGLLNPR